jgi:hypothetical protein
MSDGKPAPLRFRSFELLAFVMLVGGTLAVFRAFWQPGLPNSDLLVGAFVAMVSVATVGACLIKTGKRVAFSGVALFGWSYLVFVIYRGVTGELGSDMLSAQYAASNVRVGFLFALLVGLASHLVMRLFAAADVS